MIGELLSCLDRGGMTLAEIAKKMKIDREELHSRVHTLERAGYLEETSVKSKDCESRCVNCPISATCHDDSSEPRYLTLTSKGKAYLSKHQGKSIK